MSTNEAPSGTPNSPHSVFNSWKGKNAFRSPERNNNAPLRMGGFPKVSSFGEAFSEPAPVAPAGTRFYKARRSNMYTSEPKMDLPVTSRFKPMDMDPVEAVAVPPAPANSAVSPPPADFTSLQQQQWKERVEKLCNNMTNFMRMQAEELAREPLLHGTQKFLLEDIERLEEEKSELRRRNDELEQKVAGFERERNAWTARFQDLRSRARASAAKSSDADSEAVRTMGNRLEQARAECERLQAERNDVIYQLEQTERTRSATAERLNRMQEALHDAVSRAKAALKREDETRDLCDKNSAAAIMWESQFMQLDRMHSILKTDHHQYIVRLAAAESEATKLRTDLHRIQQELHAEQLKSKNDDADDPQGASLAECQICFDARADTVCVPCGHVTCCQSCAPRTLASRKCPLCQQAVSQSLRIYL